MAALQTDTLAELIRRKRECLLQLREMGRKEFELIDKADMTALLDLLALKQRSLMRLREIERALKPFRAQNADERTWRCEDDRQACAEQLRQCEVLFGEIINQEKLSENTLRRRRDEAAAKLQGVHNAGVARKAYASQPSDETNRLDLLSDSRPSR